MESHVPVLLRSEYGELGSSWVGRLHYKILSDPRLYDFLQARLGARPIAAQVQKHLAELRGLTVLDIGAGTGLVAGLLPAGTRYIWADNDLLKLRGFLKRRINGHAVVADAQRLPFRDDAADWTAMVEVSHHLPDGALEDCLDEAARVTRDRFLFVDALRGGRLRSRLVWQLDLGRFPRTEVELIHALEARFELERLERFRGTSYDHLLCLCIPRTARQ